MYPDRIRAATARATGTAPALTGYQKDIRIQRFAGISTNDTPLNSIHSSSKCSIGSRQEKRRRILQL